MTKEQLRKRLIDAGLSADVVDARLGQYNDTQLKEITDIPFATVLKEFTSDDGDDSGAVDELVLDESVLNAITLRTKEAVQELLDGMEINIEGLVDFKEGHDLLAQMYVAISRMEKTLKSLVDDDDARLRELNTPAAKFRVRKGGSKKVRYEEDEDEEDEDEEDEDMMAMKDSAMQWMGQSPSRNGAIVSGSGKRFTNMTDFLIGGRNNG